MGAGDIGACEGLLNTGVQAGRQHLQPRRWASLPPGAKRKKEPLKWLPSRRQDTRPPATEHRALGTERVCPGPAMVVAAPPTVLGPIHEDGMGWSLPQSMTREPAPSTHEDPSSPRSPSLPELHPRHQRKPLCRSCGWAQGHPPEDKGAILLGTLASVTAPGAARAPPSWYAKGLLLFCFIFFVFVFSSFKRKMVGGPTGLHLCSTVTVASLLSTELHWPFSAPSFPPSLTPLSPQSVPPSPS